MTTVLKGLMYHDVENFVMEYFHVKIVYGISVFQLQHDFKVEICCFVHETIAFYIMCIVFSNVAM